MPNATITITAPISVSIVSIKEAASRCSITPKQLTPEVMQQLAAAMVQSQIEVMDNVTIQDMVISGVVFCDIQRELGIEPHEYC